MIRKTPILLMLSILFLPLAACKRDKEPNKIIDGLPINNTVTVVPAQMAQQIYLVTRDAMIEFIPVINRLDQGNSAPGFSELTGPDGQSRYTFSKVEKHYGSATFTIQFIDGSGNVIDPISSLTSTTTLATARITTAGTSAQFTYTQNLVVTLQTPGILTSDKRLTGTTTFTGATDTLTMVYPAPGALCGFEGLVDGSSNGSGTGPLAQTITLTLNYSPDRNADGLLQWEGQNGGIHFIDTGSGFLTTATYRILIN